MRMRWVVVVSVLALACAACGSSTAVVSRPPAPPPGHVLRFQTVGAVSAAQRGELLQRLRERLQRVDPAASVAATGNVFTVRFRSASSAPLVAAVTSVGRLENREVRSAFPVITPGGTPLGGKSCAQLVTNPPSPQRAGWFYDAPVNGVHRVCYLLGPDLLSGTAVKSATANYVPQADGWGVDVTYRGDTFAKAVGENPKMIHQQVAIVLDGFVLVAPSICGPSSMSSCRSLPGPRVRIAGAFTQTTAKALAIALGTGSLPAALRPV